MQGRRDPTGLFVVEFVCVCSILDVGNKKRGDNNRYWMYNRVYSNRGGLKPSFITGKGFMPNYWIWDRHGEVSQEVGNESGLGGYWHENDEQYGDTWEENAARYQSMVVDAFPHQHAWMDDQTTDDYEEDDYE
ncbi:hypothetical protein PIB30_052341 [Stylosanthes scabra]|uniref:Uncharacterized protein n=1 Tax=Stylosanthes scabra TaxID=79078 RepID=A0ABU6ZGZ2_9FABA|nr:hypothetical protein [Stylosanthes scabra]